MKINLMDSGFRINDLSIVVLARNNAAYLPKLFNMLQALESRYNININYTFLENASQDDTLDLIKNFMYDREGVLASIGNTKLLDDQPRTVKMATLRNRAKDLSSKKSDWHMLIDTDIYFEADILEKIFSHNPTEKNIGMLCAYGIEIWPQKGKDDWYTQEHYYDTFAYVDQKRELYWPHCSFSTCKKCKSTAHSKVTPKGLMNVVSAFGGVALIKSDLIHQVDITWQSFQNNGVWMCEHIAFCDAVQRKGSKSVSIATDCHVFWDASTFGN
jgi:GT2 family glycosyltransferase